MDVQTRDNFAAHALNGLLSSYTGTTWIPQHEDIAKEAFQIADAMMKAREN